MIDQAMEKHGYKKTKENGYGVYYEKVEPQGYTHVVCVIHKARGHHIMQSYDKECIKVPGRNWDINSVAGVEIPVLFLMWLKAKYMQRKYHWEKRV